MGTIGRKKLLTDIDKKMATTRRRDEWLPHRTYIEMKKLFFPYSCCKFKGDDFFLQIFSEKIRGNSTKRRFLPMNQLDALFFQGDFACFVECAEGLLEGFFAHAEAFGYFLGRRFVGEG